MNKIDVYYRAFKNYRKETLNIQECVKDRNAIKNANVESDKLESTKYLCTIDESWVVKIEEGLKYVEKAIAEGRQFIRTNSEVVPIEKVKRISRESIEHLAKHSDMITRVPDNPEDNLVPDEILMVEKLTDFAVYENRFLYMLLDYLVRFIDFRLDRISKLRAKYLSDFSLKKCVESKGSKIDFEITVKEERSNNPYPLFDEKSESLLRRVNDCKQIVNALLNTELMISVSKAPMLKPPITKTNVLKMNNNFKSSLALYEYIASYKGEGFTTEEVTKQFYPFTDVQGDEIADSINLVEFISYKYGNDISNLLEAEYQKEELRRKEEEAKRVVEQIRRLKKRVAESGKSMEEYMLMLENRNKALEHVEEEFIKAKEEIVALNKEIEELKLEKDRLNSEILSLQDQIEELQNEIERLNEKYTNDMAELQEQHALEVEQLKLEREREVNDLIVAYTNEIDKLNLDHSSEVNKLNSDYTSEISRINTDYASERDSMTADYESKIATLTSDVDKQVSLRAKTIEDYQRKLDVIVNGYESIVNNLEGKLDKARQQRDVLMFEYENKLKDMEIQYFNLIDFARNESNAEVDRLKRENSLLSAQLGDKLDTEQLSQNMLDATRLQVKAELDRLQAENKSLVSYANFVKGELTAMRVQQGLSAPCDDFASVERFRELEEEFLAFKAFFKSQWKYTSRAVRDQIKN